MGFLVFCVTYFCKNLSMKNKIICTTANEAIAAGGGQKCIPRRSISDV